MIIYEKDFERLCQSCYDGMADKVENVIIVSSLHRCVICTRKYAKQRYYIVRRKNKDQTEMLPLEELPDYATPKKELKELTGFLKGIKSTIREMKKKEIKT